MRARERMDLSSGKRYRVVTAGAEGHRNQLVMCGPCTGRTLALQPAVKVVEVFEFVGDCCELPLCVPCDMFRHCFGEVAR